MLNEGNETPDFLKKIFEQYPDLLSGTGVVEQTRPGVLEKISRRCNALKHLFGSSAKRENYTVSSTVPPNAYASVETEKHVLPAVESSQTTMEPTLPAETAASLMNTITGEEGLWEVDDRRPQSLAVASVEQGTAHLFACFYAFAGMNENVEFSDEHKYYNKRDPFDSGYLALSAGVAGPDDEVYVVDENRGFIMVNIFMTIMQNAYDDEGSVLERAKKNGRPTPVGIKIFADAGLVSLKRNADTLSKRYKNAYDAVESNNINLLADMILELSRLGFSHDKWLPLMQKNEGNKKKVHSDVDESYASEQPELSF